MTQAKQQIITAQDGQTLVSHWFEPSAVPCGAVVIAPAMGVPQKFYRSLAEWLAERGYLAVTFDYRGMGQSAPRQLKGFEATLRDWAEQDCGAVLQRLVDSYPNIPVYWIGHSFGGQILGLIPNRQRIQKAVTVASGNGYWRPRQRVPSLFLWYALVPIAHQVWGYFPGRKIGVVGDVPKNAMAQWRRWCLSPRYLFDAEEDAVAEQYAAILFPITAFSISDDEMMTAEGIATIHQYFVNAPKTIHQLDPSALNIDPVGHFGFFREKFREPLWERRLGPELVV